MQPNQPYNAPSKQPSYSSSDVSASDQNIQPNYDFLNEKPLKARRLPSFGQSRASRIMLVSLGLLVLVIVFIFIKNLIIPASFNKSAFNLVVERQQIILHILSTDVTTSNSLSLTLADQNFAQTALLSLQAAQNQTLTFLTDNGYKISPQQLALDYNSSVDLQLKNALAANDFDSVFKADMQSQLNYYLQDLRSAYDTTRSIVGRQILDKQYNEAKLLMTGLNSPTS